MRKYDKRRHVKYGYGIINFRGEAWWDDSCVCEDREPLDDIVRELNENHGEGTPYRVVTLYFTMKTRLYNAYKNGAIVRRPQS